MVFAVVAIIVGPTAIGSGSSCTLSTKAGVVPRRSASSGIVGIMVTMQMRGITQGDSGRAKPSRRMVFMSGSLFFVHTSASKAVDCLQRGSRIPSIRLDQKMPCSTISHP